MTKVEKFEAECYNVGKLLENIGERLGNDALAKALAEDETPEVLARQFAALQELNEKAKAVKTEIGKTFDWYRVVRGPERMDELGISSSKVPGIGRLGVTMDIRMSVRDNEGLMLWLEESGRSDLIKQTVNTSTLKAVLRKMLKEDAEIPGVVEVSPMARISITKG